MKLRSYRNCVFVKGQSHRLVGSFYLRVKKGGKVYLGDKLSIVNGSGFNPIARNIKSSLCVEEDAIITIGDNVGISGSCLWAHNSITIGNNVNIGADSVIVDSDCHSLNYLDRGTQNDQKNKVSKPIVIEDDVLIGARSIVLKGVTIGARSVIGAGSVVSQSVPSGEIWAGNPAHFIRKI